MKSCAWLVVIPGTKEHHSVRIASSAHVALRYVVGGNSRSAILQARSIGNASCVLRIYFALL